MLVNLPAQYLTTSFSRVLFPSFSRIQKETERLKKVYLTTIMLFSAILLPTCLGITIASQEIVLLVLGEKWIAAIPVLQILAIAAYFNLLLHFGGIVCEATASLNIMLLIQIICVIILAGLFYLVRGMGLSEFATVLLFGNFVRFLAYLFTVNKICNIKPIEHVRAYLPSLVSSVIISFSIYSAATILRNFNVAVWLLFVVEFSIGVGLLIVIFFYGPQQTLRKEIKERLINSGIIVQNNTIVGKAFNILLKSLSGNLGISTLERRS